MDDICKQAERGPLCTTPVACQCRRKGSTLSTDVIDSKINNNPYSLNFENDWGCQLVNGDCQLRCQKSRQALLKTCFDFEMRALCPKTGELGKSSALYHFDADV